MKNSFCKRIKQKKNIEEAVIKALTMQLMWDAISITLNDPEIMGRDTFGAARLKRVCRAAMDYFNTAYIALTENVEADVVKHNLDKRIQAIYKDDFEPFDVRYGLEGILDKM